MALRPIPLSILGGSLASVLLRSFEDHLPFDFPPAASLQEACLGPEFLDFVHWPSLGLGVIIGFFLGPIIDLLYLLRVWWAAFVRERLLVYRRQQGPLYRIL